MDGLSTRTAVDGIMRGVDFMDRREERKQISGLREAQEKRSQQSHEMGLADAGRRREILDKQDKRSDVEWMNKQGDLRRKQAAEALYFYDITGDKSFLQYHPMTNGQGVEAANVAKKVASGEIPLGSPEVAKYMPYLAPEVLTDSSANVTGVNRILPGKQPGTFVVALNVEGSDKPVPVTVDRSSSPDSEIKQFGVDGIIQRAAAHLNMPYIVDNPEARRAFYQSEGFGVSDSKSEFGKMVTDLKRYKPGSEEYSMLKQAILNKQMKEINNTYKTIKTYDEMGNVNGEQIIQISPDGAKKVIYGGQGSPGAAPSQENLNAEADQFAEQRINETAGYLSSDKEDFAKWGGSRAKAKEYFRQQFLDGKAGDPISQQSSQAAPQFQRVRDQIASNPESAAAIMQALQSRPNDLEAIKSADPELYQILQESMPTEGSSQPQAEARQPPSVPQDPGDQWSRENAIDNAVGVPARAVGDAVKKGAGAVGEVASGIHNSIQSNTKESKARMMFDYYAKKGGSIPYSDVKDAWPYLSDQERQQAFAKLTPAQRLELKQQVATR